MWSFIHVLYLIGWGNRLGTLYTWLRALVFSKNRGHRIIAFEGATDRVAEGGTSGRAIRPPRPRQEVVATEEAARRRT
jgi:NADH dehydrogenase